MLRRSLLTLPLLLLGASDRAGTLEQSVFAAVNQQRRKRRLPDFRWSGPVALEARRHSRRMLAMKYFSHDDPEFGDPGARLARAGIHWRSCGENIYEEQGFDDPVGSAVQSWLHSSGHRRNMLARSFDHSGVGVAIGSGREYMITQMFVTL